MVAAAVHVQRAGTATKESEDPFTTYTVIIAEIDIFVKHFVPFIVAFVQNARVSSFFRHYFGTDPIRMNLLRH